MNISGKIRIAIFFVILIILAYFSVGYAYSIYDVDVAEYLIDTSNVENITFDGEDFTLFFLFAGSGLYVVLVLLTYGMCALAILIVSLILALLLRFIGNRKGTQISEQEQKISKWMFAGMIFMSVIIGLILTRGNAIIPLLIYTLIWVIVVWLIYILRICRCSDAQNV